VALDRDVLYSTGCRMAVVRSSSPFRRPNNLHAASCTFRILEAAHRPAPLPAGTASRSYFLGY